MDHRNPHNVERGDLHLEEAITAAERLGLEWRIPGPRHLKVGKVNYFWTTGRVTVDGEPTIDAKGQQVFIARLLSPAASLVSKPVPAANKRPPTPNSFPNIDPPF